MRIILVNLFILAGLAGLYYLDVFSLFSDKYMSWFAILLVMSVFIIAIKMIGSPFSINDDDDDDDKDDDDDHDFDDGVVPTRKKNIDD